MGKDPVDVAGEHDLPPEVMISPAVAVLQINTTA